MFLGHNGLFSCLLAGFFINIVPIKAIISFPAYITALSLGKKSHIYTKLPISYYLTFVPGPSILKYPNFHLKISYFLTIYVVNLKACCVKATFILGKCGKTGRNLLILNKSTLPSLTVSE